MSFICTVTGQFDDKTTRNKSRHRLVNAQIA